MISGRCSSLRVKWQTYFSCGGVNEIKFPVFSFSSNSHEGNRRKKRAEVHAS